VRFLTLALAFLCAPAWAQDPQAPASENWNLSWQATSIGQTHPPFTALYTGPLSLVPHREADVSITTTLYFGLRLTPNTQFYFDPEVAGGRAFSNTNGVANFPNGEMPRVSTATPKPYIARLFVTHDFAFGDEREPVEGDQDQLAGSRPVNRYTLIVGRFTVTDFFDDNKYSHDPRTQFMGWAIMYNGAWDYPADTRGYTWGWVHELHTRHWSFRYGTAAMPRVANGLRFDRRIFRNHADMAEVERRFQSGTVRLLLYRNHYQGGSYAVAINQPQPNVADSALVGRLKYGFGISADQEIVKGVGVFGRLGWNDGKNESFAFTVMDRLAEGGVSVNGARWHRKDDTVATALTVAGLSGVHATYLARGGLDFLIGDGKLQYGPETVWESYYSARLFPGFFVTLDAQHITNPAYNQDRGPLWAYSLRLHVEAGKK
jgi:high affinity Mn2+ porin